MIAYESTSRDIINGIENSLRTAFSDMDKGTLNLRFMSMHRGTEISTNFITDEIVDSKEVRSKIINHISLSAISELREIMNDKNGKGAWLSGEITFDCLTEEFEITFDYDDRFNVLTENWEYSDTDEEIFPDRNTLLKDFEKFPRSDSNIPDWYFDLLHEQRQVKKMIKNAKPENIFKEQMEVNPQFEEKFSYLNDSEDWKTAWDQLSVVYIKTLMSDKTLITMFVDDSKIPDRASYIFDEFEPSVLDSFLTKFTEKTPVELRVRMIDFVQLSKGLTESYDMNDADLDTDILEEEFEDIVVSLVMSQTRQRFPDLDDVIF